MRTFLFEWRKMMRHHLGFVIIPAFAVITVGLIILLDSPYNTKMEVVKESYIQYMEKLSGPLTDENAEFVEQEGDAITDAEAQRSFLYDQFYERTIDENELHTGLAKLEPVLSRAYAYDIVYEQYQYVSGNRENRYLLPTNGWNALLARNDLDIMLYLVILLLITPVFCGEYSCQMELLLVTSRNRKKDVWHKIFLSFLVVSILCVFTYSFKYLFCMAKYGLPNAEYPLQSLSYFGECGKSVSLQQAYLIISALKIFGFMYLSAMILALSALLKKYAPTVFLSAASVLLAYFAFTYEQYSRIPVPFSFMMAASYFLGPKYYLNYATGDSKVLYIEVLWPELVLLVLTAFGAMLLCIFLVLWRSRNHWDCSRIGICKKTGLLFLCLALIMSLYGCNDLDESGNTAIYYNCNDPRSYVSEKYIVTADGSTGTLTVENRKTGDIYDLDRDAVSGLSSINTVGISSVYGKDDTVYYLMAYKEMLQIREVNLDTMEEKIVFENMLNSTIDFLGLDIDRKTKWSDFAAAIGVFVDDDYFYFTFSDGTSIGLRKVNRLTLSITPLEVPIVNAFYDGEYYYCLDDVGVLTKYDLHTGEVSEISSVVAKNCYYYQARLYYVNRMDKNYVYSCRADGTDQKLEAAERCVNIFFQNEELIAMLVSGDVIVLAEP